MSKTARIKWLVVLALSDFAADFYIACNNYGGNAHTQLTSQSSGPRLEPCDPLDITLSFRGRSVVVYSRTLCLMQLLISRLRQVDVVNFLSKASIRSFHLAMLKIRSVYLNLFIHLCTSLTLLRTFSDTPSFNLQA